MTRPLRIFAVAALAVLLTSWAAPGQAATGDDPLADALEAIDGLRYQDALDFLQPLLGRRDLPARDRNRALELEAACRVYLGDPDAARAGFRALSRRDPGWSLAGDYPPRVRALFEEAVSAALPPVEVVFERVGVVGLAGVAVRLGTGADAVDRVWLVTRLPDGTEVKEPFVDVGGTLQAPLPPAATSLHAPVAYTVQAAAPSGFVLATLVGEWTPIELAPPPPPLPPPPPPPLPPLGPPPPLVVAPPVVEGPAWYESWWFWTVVGAVVAGGAVTAGVLLAPEPAGPRDGSEGSWVVW